MNGFIFGFQRFVWWPKWTPASSSSGTNSIVLDIGMTPAGGGAADGEDATPLSLWQPEFRAPQRAQCSQLRVAVGDQLLQHWEADFTVIQGIAKIAAFEDPGGGNPTQRQTGELFDVIRRHADQAPRGSSH